MLSINNNFPEICALDLWCQFHKNLFSHSNIQKYQKDLLFSKIKYVKKCNFTPKYLETSTEHDAIVTFSFNYLINIFPFVRSLRTTGCKAKIVILCDPATFGDSCNDDQFAILKSWGVIFIPLIEEIIYGRSKIYYHKIKAYLDFTYAYGYLFDRLFFCDLADISFQLDPFFDLPGNKVYTFYEDLQIHDDGEAKSQLVSYFNDTNHLDKQLISGMSFYGSPDQIYLLLEKVFSYLEEGSELVDQTIVNYLYYNNLFYPIHWSIIYPEGTVIALQVYKFDSIKYGKIIPTNHSLVPHVLHHLHYSYEALAELYKVCPRTSKGGKTPYILLLTEQQLDDLDLELSKASS